MAPENGYAHKFLEVVLGKRSLLSPLKQKIQNAWRIKVTVVYDRR